MFVVVIDGWVGVTRVTATGAIYLGGQQTVRTWTVGWTGIAGALFASTSGTIVQTGGACVTVGLCESQSGMGLIYLGTGELVFIGSPQYRSQLSQIFLGSGALGCNGGGQITVIGVPLYVARIANCNVLAASDYFLGGMIEYG